MSRGFGMVGVGCFLALLAMECPDSVLADPVCLASRGTTLYRFNADGNGLMQEFPGQGGIIIGLTRVPAGVTVTGCLAGDVLAVEFGDGGRFWRVDYAACGTPVLVHVGNMPPNLHVSSIAFAHGQFFGINEDGLFREFNPVTFALVQGSGVNVSTGSSTVGGFSFDGVSAWYATDGQASNLFRFTDPPMPASWQLVGSVGVTFNQSGLEFFGRELWGALRVLGSPARLSIGSFNLQTGAFTARWEWTPAPPDYVGFVALPARSMVAGDINCDGHVDMLDVEPFVLALTSPGGFAAVLPDCSLLSADLSGDCLVNGNDIQPFVDRLLGS